MVCTFQYLWQESQMTGWQQQVRKFSSADASSDGWSWRNSCLLTKSITEQNAKEDEAQTKFLFPSLCRMGEQEMQHKASCPAITKLVSDFYIK